MGKAVSPVAIKNALRQSREIVDEVIPWEPDIRQGDMTHLRATALQMIFAILLEE
jgi:hypothetical protein